MKLSPLAIVDERTDGFTSRKLANTLIPQDNLNAVALVAVYTIYGFDDIDIHTVSRLPMGVIERIRESIDYKTFLDDITGAILEVEQGSVRSYLLSKSRDAAHSLVRRLDSKDEAVALRAADSILDRSGHRPVDVHEHRVRLENTLNIRYTEPEGRPVTIDAEYEDVRP